MAKAKAVDTQGHFEVFWDDEGTRRHQLSFDHDAAQEIARGLIENHNLKGVGIQRVTRNVEPVKLSGVEES